MKKNQLKSSIEDLEKRGYIEHLNVSNYLSLSKQELMILLRDKSAVNRSIATRVIIKQNIIDKEIELFILKLLLHEKALYTRLEFSLLLSLGNQETANMLIPYLGVMKCNQYIKLPSDVSKKKSYPLPRDLIARILCRMDCQVLDVLLEGALIINETKLSELIDAIGHMCFYHQELATISTFIKLYKIYQIHLKNSIICYKCIIAFSAFPLDKTKELLQEIVKEYPNSIFEKEAKRSLSLLQLNKV